MLLLKPEGHCSVQKITPLYSILNQMNPHGSVLDYDTTYSLVALYQCFRRRNIFYPEEIDCMFLRNTDNNSVDCQNLTFNIPLNDALYQSTFLEDPFNIILQHNMSEKYPTRM
jgi:hypothetical protein